MAEVPNEEVTRVLASPYMLYVEGESDERILRAWARVCEADDALGKVCFRVMGGGSKQLMKENADQHFAALKQIVPHVRRLMLFDYDEAASYHPEPDNPALFEWKRKNIENYLLVPEAWIRAALKQIGVSPNELFAVPVTQAIVNFFAGENLSLPVGKTWRELKARIFSDINGKKLLYENDESLFQVLRQNNPPIELIRETVAGSMELEEVHADVIEFFAKLKSITETHAQP
jgi:hypothetical protein